ncbi:hypothetical protein SAMN05892883_0224 [Jatrophihabitans sp. GAS493]|uniref:hypothetical protein n=1 Tax=Jatrophihabitans sp. GAS493 TaxID=1907575 RepID=UPI000BBFF2A7|nr:hypothetical protein [Jatrophihabitans sp. GAS493]SOD70534.1 hypothetical protein SAMN05892883_0224 [Jatrophihabitans sp. GAS493]
MFHPVGSRPSAIYWRRRLILLSIVVLALVTVFLVLSLRGSDSSSTASKTSTPAASTGAAVAPSSTEPSSSGPSSSAPNASPSPKASTVAVVAPCPQSSLTIRAGTGAPSYPVSAQPVLYMQVTNIGPVPCSKDLSDTQIELVVYNGASRVWGSHDCQIIPGSSVQTLAVNMPIARSITWTGLSSQPGCVGVRQHVAAGTYTLRASLGGVQGTPATFKLV